MDGHSLKGRLEDRRLLTGNGIFASDRNLPGQLHAAFLRSDRAHAELVAMDAGAAQGQFLPPAERTGTAART